MVKNLEEAMNGYNNNLLVLKFVCSILVVLSHSYAIIGLNSGDILTRITNNELSLGALAVVIFLFLSGLMNYRSLERNSNISFLKKRIFRIFPELWNVCLLIFVFLGPICSTETIGQYFTNPINYLFLLNCILIIQHNLSDCFATNPYPNVVNGSLWTLPLEFICYVLLFFVNKIKLLKQEYMKIYNFIIVILYGLIIYKFKDYVAYVRPLVMFYVGVYYGINKEKIVINKKIGIIGILLLIVSCLIGAINIILPIALPYVIICFVMCTKQIQNKYIIKISKLFYTIYLIAFPIQQVLVKYITNLTVFNMTVFTMVISLFIAVVIQKMVSYQKNIVNYILTRKVTMKGEI